MAHEIAARALSRSHQESNFRTRLEQIFRTRTTGKFIGGSDRAHGELGGYGSRFASSVTLDDLLNAPWESKDNFGQHRTFTAPITGELGWVDIAEFRDEELVSIMLVGCVGWCVTVDTCEGHKPQTVSVATLVTYMSKSVPPIDCESDVQVADVFPGEWSPLKGARISDSDWLDDDARRDQLQSELNQMGRNDKKLTISEARTLGFDRVYLKEQ